MSDIYEDIKEIFPEWDNSLYGDNPFFLKLSASYKQLKSKNLPLIFDIHSCSQAMNVNAYLLRGVIKDIDKLYRTFNIPKQSGGTRLIEAPTPALLRCQKWIAYYILNEAELHHSATAYRKNISILKNVQDHLGQKHVLKVDLKDFFHSIKINRVIAVFKKLGYLQDAALIFAKICCHKNRLSQGSATSPTLSNIIAKRLDNRFYGLAQKYNLNYTRYSDDIAFSGEHIQKNLIQIVNKIINDEGFSINHKKTRLYVKQGKRIITGVSVSEATPKIPRDKKRAIKQEVYELLKSNNIQDFIKTTHQDVFFLESLKGKLYFWCHIEEDAIFPREALEKLKQFEAL
ncbi:MAG: hypothetical protein ACJAQ0_000328 [Dasania sp.]|jgi:hypothetical protein